jgi:hypothetical protein
MTCQCTDLLQTYVTFHYVIAWGSRYVCPRRGKRCEKIVFEREKKNKKRRRERLGRNRPDRPSN